MSFNIYPETKIYIACPANIATGGPELLHQLNFKLNNFGLKSFMYYYSWDWKTNPVHDNYKKYTPLYKNIIEDKKENLLIVPEVAPHLFIDKNKIQKCLWWLSIDNFYSFLKSRFFIKKFISALLYKYTNHYKSRKLHWLAKQGIVHFVQSEYARQFLFNKGFRDVFFLSDYLNNTFIAKKEREEIRKKDQVVYNPKKGFFFTKKLISQAKDINFLPIENLTPQEVSSLLSESKVYIDFGHHPGKDRLPREAAISKCCVITGKDGSAQFHEDVPIPAKYKFETVDQNIIDILSTIRGCLNNYETAINEFQEYREMIRSEENKFDDDIKKLFLKANA